MIGIEDEGLALLADNNIHVHSYTENYYESRFSAEQNGCVLHQIIFMFMLT